MDNTQLEKLAQRARTHLDQWEGRWTDVVGPSTPENPTLKPVYGRSMDLLNKYVACEADYFLRGNDAARIHDPMASIAELAADYLTGSWRQQAIADDRESLDWMDQVRLGLHAAPMADDMEAVQAIGTFLDSDPAFESGTWKRTKHDVACYRGVCGLRLSDQPQQPLAVKGTRPKQFAKVLQAIESQDDASLKAAFRKYMATYVSKEHSDQGNILFSIDGSLLAELIRWKRDGSLPLEFRDYLITTARFE